MKKTLSLALLLVCTSSLLFAVEIVEMNMPKSNKIVMQFRFRNGSVCDPVGKEGLTYLTTQLITEGGTKSMTREQITDKIYPWAAAYYSSCDKEVSDFVFQVPAEFIEQFYTMAKEILLAPSFLQADFERVKSNQQNYVDQVIRSSSDEEYGKKLLEDMLFRGTNYQYPVQGTSKSISAITLDDVKTHYARFFTSANLTIGIAGNYTSSFLAQVKKDMEKQLPSTKPEIPAPGNSKMSEGLNVEIVAKENALGSAISAGFPMNVTRASDDFAALMVANSWLGEHRKSYSRLYKKIREERSMNYGDYTYIEWYENGGGNMMPPSGTPRSSNYFSIWLRPVQTAKGLKGQYAELSELKIGHAHFALRMALKEMSQLITNGLSQQDFENTRIFLRSYMKLYAQTPGAKLGYLMDSKFYGRKDYLAEMDALLAKITVNDVNKAMKKYWQTNNMNIVIVTDQSEAKNLEESLKTGAASPMSYSNNLKAALSAEILDEDKSVEKYPMPVRSVRIINSEDTFRSVTR
jgi:zinc protease